MVRIRSLTTDHIQIISPICIGLEQCSIVFADEEWFDQDGQFNRQNDCVYVES